MRDLICLGGSAGAIAALQTLLPQLPADLAAAVFIVVHIPSAQDSQLPRVLGARAAVPVEFALDGELYAKGRVYVAPPDHHLLLEGPRLRVLKGPKENRSRPAIDPLFRSVAEEGGPRSVGVILSGLLADGAAGLWALRRAGGLAVVQEPGDAQFPEMVAHALDATAVDHRVPAAGLGTLLAKLSLTPVGNRRRISKVVALANQHTAMEVSGNFGKDPVVAVPHLRRRARTSRATSSR